MNQNVRQYLINKARQDRPVHYEDVNKDCNLGLNLELPSDRHILSVTLGEISQYEREQQRPLLSAMAIYKQTQDHGNGFYDICQQMGFGKASTLKANLFGFEQMAICRTFWRDDNNYLQFYEVSNSATDTVIDEADEIDDIEFFTLQDVDFFTQYGGIIYDQHNQEHFDAKNVLMETVFAKTQYWTKKVAQQFDDFLIIAKRVWQNPGWDNSIPVNRIKHYTWGRIFRQTAKDLGIYFTVGVDVVKQGLVYKLDYEHNSKTNQLTTEQKRLCGELIPSEIKNIVIPFNQIPNYNWELLINEVVEFITTNLDTYDSIIQSVRAGVINVPKLKNKLIERDLPEDGHTEIPPRTFSFEGVDVDWGRQHQANSDLGKAGEELVIKTEKLFLESKNRHDLAEQVKKVKDGCGYDISSYNEDGTPKHIEVKTTTGNYTNAFDITLNEVEYSRQHSKHYYLYRLFNFNADKNTAEFHKYYGSLDNHFHLEGISFKAHKKAID